MKLMSLVAVLAASSMVLAQTSQSEKIDTQEGQTTAQSKVIGSASGVTAAGTVQAIVNPDQDILSRFSGSFVDEMETTQDSISTGNVGNAPVSHAMGAALNYKINNRLSVGVGQDAMTTTQSGMDNKFYLTNTSIRLGTQFGGIFGSEAIKPIFRYYIPTTEAREVFERSANGDVTGYGGILRADAQISWTLNSLVSIAYYMNPRQTILSKQTVNAGTDEEVNLQSITRYYHYVAVNFAPNDIVGPYVYLGQDYRMATESFTTQRNDALLGIGTSISLGKFTINPEIYSLNTVKANYQDQEARYLSHETLKYYLAASVAF